MKKGTMALLDGHFNKSEATKSQKNIKNMRNYGAMSFHFNHLWLAITRPLVFLHPDFSLLGSKGL